MRKTIAIAALASGLTWLSSNASATLIAYEGFDYPAGTGAIVASGGTGWLGNWDSSPNFTINGTGLTQGGLAVTGGTATGPASDGVDISRQFTATNSGSLWFSYLVTSAPGSYTKFMMRNTNFATPVYVGIEPWESSIHAGGLFDNGNLGTRNQQYLVLARIDFNAGTTANNEAVRIWMFADPNTPTGIAPTDGSATYTDLDVTDLGTLNRARIHLSNANSKIDEIRIGTTFADVAPVPEPAALALCAIGGLAMLRRRR